MQVQADHNKEARTEEIAIEREFGKIREDPRPELHISAGAPLQRSCQALERVHSPCVQMRFKKAASRICRWEKQRRCSIQRQRKKMASLSISVDRAHTAVLKGAMHRMTKTVTCHSSNNRWQCNRWLERAQHKLWHQKKMIRQQCQIWIRYRTSRIMVGVYKIGILVTIQVLLHQMLLAWTTTSKLKWLLHLLILAIMQQLCIIKLIARSQDSAIHLQTQCLTMYQVLRDFIEGTHKDRAQIITWRNEWMTTWPSNSSPCLARISLQLIGLCATIHFWTQSVTSLKVVLIMKVQ